MAMTTTIAFSESEVAEACKDGKLDIVLILAYLENPPIRDSITETGRIKALGVLEVLKRRLLDSLCGQIRA